MANEKIEAWLKLKKKDFNKGLQLFTENSKNRSIYLYLSRKQNMEKLTYELQKLAGIFIVPVVKEENKTEDTGIGPEVTNPGMTADPNTEETIEVTITRVVTEKKINPDALPEDKKKIYDDVVDAYKQQRAYHEKMKLAQTDEERAGFRAEVVRLDNIIAEGWKELDAPAADPAPENDNKIDPVAIAREIGTSRKYISTNLPKLFNDKQKKKEELKEKITKRYQTLVNLKADIAPETIEELKKAGIIQ